MMEQNLPTLPALDDGVTLLETDERASGVLHTLALDHLLLEDGSAIWVDAHDHGTTQPLLRIAPTMRLLDRVRIARAFTPWQHQGLLRDLAASISDGTTLVVLPELDWFYRSDDLGRGEGKRMLSAAVDIVAELAATTDVPVLLTTHRDDERTASVRALADDVVRCEGTKFGPRFLGEEFETLVYPLSNGLVQTTLAFWKHVLTTRHPAVTGADAPTEVNARGAN